MYILYNIKKGILDIVDKKDVIDSLYYLKTRIPNKDDIKKYSSKGKNKDIIKYFKKYGVDNGINNIKISISKIDYKIPLYDVNSKNIYIINRDRVYDRVVYQHYRFPDIYLVDKLKQKKNKMEPLIKKIKKSGIKEEEQKHLGEKIKKSKGVHENIIILREYRKLKLMLDFMSSYDLDELKITYIKVFCLPILFNA